MPELPEVETIRRTLSELVIGKTISKCDVFWPKMIKKPDDIEEFKHRIVGQTIHQIDRRGKFLKFILDQDVLVSHLRMEGRYGLFQPDEPWNKHVHVVFTFTDGTELRYQDVRKFGTMHLFTKGEEESSLPLSNLGVEPFSPEFTLSYFQTALKKTERKIKQVLLDQAVVVGLGNIYVDEALFRAGVHPETQASQLTPSKVTLLRDEMIATLSEAVDKGGSTVRSYVNTQGQIGMFQLDHYVYARNGEPCRRCGSEIVKLKVGGRGTHICPNCQGNG